MSDWALGRQGNADPFLSSKRTFAPRSRRVWAQLRPGNGVRVAVKQTESFVTKDDLTSEPTTDNNAGVRHFDRRGWEKGKR